MSEINNAVLQLSFVGGDVLGAMKVSYFGFPGILYKIPRYYLRKLELINLIDKPGVYLLINDDFNDDIYKPKVYVGHSMNVLDRVKYHNNDEDKGWFSEVLVITSNDNFFNEAHIKFIESSLIKQINDVKRFELDNSDKPISKINSEFKVPLLEFIKKSMFMITTLGYKLFVKPQETDIVNDEIVYFYNKIGTPKEAKIYETNEGVILCKGSYVSPKETKSIYKWIKRARAENFHKIKNNILTEDIVLNSPSLAAGFVSGASANGHTFWKSKDNIEYGMYIKNYT